MTTQKLLPALQNNHTTNIAHFDGINNSSNALNSLELEATYGIINSYNYELKNMNETPFGGEVKSATKAQEFITSWYQSPVTIFFNAVERKNFEEIEYTFKSIEEGLQITIIWFNNQLKNNKQIRGIVI